MKIDDAENFFLNFETDLPAEAGAIPVGMYFAWLADNRLLGSDPAHAVTRCRSASTPPSSAELFLMVCDGKLMASDLSPEGREFTQHYYARQYLRDYALCFNVDGGSVDALCSVEDTPAQVQRLAKGLTLRYQQWQSTRKAPTSATASTTTAAQTAEPPLPPTLAAVMEGLHEQCVPLLERDGYSVTQTGHDILTFNRKVGDVEQQVRISCTGDGGNTGRSVTANLEMRLGSERLQSFWLPLLDPGYAQRPPAEAQRDLFFRPAIRVGTDNFLNNSSVIAPILARNQHLHNRWPTVMADAYVEHLRPVLDATHDIEGLAAIAHAMRRKTPLYGDYGPPRIEVLNLIALYAIYPPADEAQPLLQGPNAAQFKARLLKPVQMDTPEGTFPRRADLERMFDIAMQPGFAERAREQLARSPANP